MNGGRTVGEILRNGGGSSPEVPRLTRARARMGAQEPTNRTNQPGTAFLTERSRPSREQVARRTNAGKVWGDNSEAYPEELRIASRRVRALEGRGLDHEELCAALAEYALAPDLEGAPHHAIGFTEYVARTWIAKLRDERRLPAQIAAKYERRDSARVVAGIDLRALVKRVPFTPQEDAAVKVANSHLERWEASALPGTPYRPCNCESCDLARAAGWKR